MARFKRAVDAFAVCVVFPIVLLLLGSIAIAVGVQALAIYVGALLAAWLFTAIGLPIVTGAMAPGEFLEGFRSQRRSERLYDGEPLPGRKLGFPGRKLRFPSLRRAMASGETLDGFRSTKEYELLVKLARRRSERLYDGEPLPDPYSKTF